MKRHMKNTGVPPRELIDLGERTLKQAEMREGRSLRSARIKLEYHIPNFASWGNEEPEIDTFNSQEEMLSCERVQNFAETRPSYFALSDDALMIVENNGTHWWCIGHIIQGLEDVSLPQIGYHNDRAVPKNRDYYLAKAADVKKDVDEAKQRYAKADHPYRRKVALSDYTYHLERYNELLKQANESK